MKKKLMVLMAMLTMVLSVASPAFARSEPVVKATGRLAEIADHPYATHGIRDEASGTEYLLRSDTVGLYSYLGQRVNVYGTYTPAEASSEPEDVVSGDVSSARQEGSEAADGSRLLNVHKIELARYMGDPTPCDEFLPNGEPNPDYDQNDPECLDPNETVTVTFELTIDGEVPEGKMLAVATGIQDIGQPVFCSTTTYDSGLPRCEDGATYSDTFEASAGRFSYEYTVFDQNYGGVVETFAADTRTLTEDETVSATYRAGDPGNKIEVIEATGTLEKPEVTNYMYGSHATTDEASGEYYALESSIVDLDSYVGQSVTTYGALVPGYENGQVEGGPPLIDVYTVVPAGGPGQETVTVTFELTAEGEPPTEATFFGHVGDEDYGYYVTLSDPDGDGVYSGSQDFGKAEQLEDGPSGELPFQIVQGTGSEEPNTSRGYAIPGEPVRTIKDFGSVKLDKDKTLSASVSFKDGNESSGSGRFLSDVAGEVKGILPSTGGSEAFAMLGGGALLIVGGLVLRKLVWR